MKKRKKKSKIYFGTPVHEAIIRYNHSDNPIERNKIYTEEIHAAFLKLAENIINTFDEEDWREGFIKEPLIIDYCKRLQIRFENENDIEKYQNKEKQYPKKC